MPNNIEERVVQMRFENEKFEANAKESISTLQKLKQVLNFDGFKKSLTDFKKSADSFSLDQMVSNISKGIDQINSRYSILGKVVDSVKDDISNAMTTMAKQTIDTVSSLTGISQVASEIGQATSYISKSIQDMSPAQNMSAGWDKYAQKTTAVQTIMNATGKSIEEVEAQLGELQWFSDETSYSFTDMTSNVGKFTSQNIDLETSVKAMMGVANAAALAGANSTEASRAMYNISQAMGAGSMKLIDWKSIENANMATTQFKQSMIDAAVSVGTLKKAGDGVWKTTKGTEVTVKNFNSALSEGWLNSEAMLEALQDYGKYADVVYQKAEKDNLTCAEAMEALGDGYDELGMKAFKAAQEAKTFADMVDATKDAVSSQWSNIFQELFGNYEEAKVIWTWWSNELWDAFAGPLEGVAEMLHDWHEGGGYDAGIEAVTYAWYGLKEVISDVSEIWHTVFPTMEADELIKKTEQIRDTFKGFYESATNFLNPGRERSEGVVWYENQFKEVQEIANKWYNGNVRLAAIDKIQQALNKEATTVDENGNVWQKAKYTYADAIRKYDEYTQQYQEAIAAEEKANKRTGNITSTLGGVKNAIDIVKQAVSAFKKVFVDPVIQKIPDMLDWILEHTSKIASAITRLRNKLAHTNAFENLFTAIRDRIIQAKDAILEFIDRAKGLDSVQTLLGHLRDFWEMIKTLSDKGFTKILDFFRGTNSELSKFTMDDAVNALDSAVQKLNKFIERIKDAWPSIVSFVQDLAGKFQGLTDSAKEFIENPSWDAAKTFIKDLLSGGWDGLIRVLGKIGNWFVSFIDEVVKSGKLKEWGKTGAKTVFEGVKEYISGVNWLEVLKQFAIVGFFAEIASGIVRVVTGIATVIRGFSDVPDAIVSIFDRIRGMFKGMERDMNANAILKIAIAIGVLAVSLYVLGKMPADSMERALTAIAVIGTIVGVIALVLSRSKAKKAEEALDSTSKVFDLLHTFVDYVGQGVKSLLSKLGIAAIISSVGASFLMIAAGIGIIVGSILLIKKFGGDVEDIGAALAPITYMLNEIMNFLLIFTVIGLVVQAANKDSLDIAKVLTSVGKTFAKITTGILEIAIAIAALTYVQNMIGDIRPVASILEEIAAAIAGIIIVLTVITKEFGNQAISKSATAFTMMTAALAIVAGVLTMMSTIADPDELAEVATILVATTGSLVLIMAALAAIASGTGVGNLGVVQLYKMSVLLGAVAAAVFTIAEAAAVVAETGTTMQDVVTILVAFFGILASIVIVAKAIQVNELTGTMIGLAASLAIMAVSFITVSAGMYILAKAAEAIANTDNGLQTVANVLILLVGTLGALIVAALAIDKLNLAPTLTSMIVLFIGLGVGIAALGAGIMVLSAAVNSMDNVGVTLLAFIGVIATLAIAAAVINKYNLEDALTSLMTTLIGLGVAVAVFAVGLYGVAMAVQALVANGVGIMQVVAAIIAFVAVLATLIAASYVIEQLNLEDALLGIAIVLAAIGVGVLAFAAGVALLSSNASAIPEILQNIGLGIALFGQAIEDNSKAALIFVGVMLVIAVAATAVAFGISKIIEAMSMVLKNLEPFMGQLAASFPKMKTLLISGVALLVIGILEYLSGSMGLLVDTLVKLLLQALNSLAQAISNNAFEFGAVINNIILALVDLLFEGLAGVFGGHIFDKQKVKEFLGFDQLATDIGTQTEELGEGISENLAELKKNTSGSLTDLIDGVNSVSQNNPLNLTGAINSVGSSVSSADPVDPNMAKKWGNNISTNIAEGEEEESGSVISALQSMMGDSGDLMEGGNGLFSDGGNGWIQSLTSGMGDGEVDLDAMSEMLGMSSSDEIYNYDGHYESGADNIVANAEGMESEEGTVTAEADEIGDLVISELDVESQTYTSGQNAITGFILGLKSKVSELLEEVSGIGSDVMSTFNESLGEESPSKLTKQSGKYFVQGFVNGINALSGSAEDASDDLGSNTIKAFQAAIDGSQNLLDSEFDIDPTIRPVIDLTDVNAGMNSMNTMFSGYKPTLSFNGIGNIPNIGSLNAAITSNAYDDGDVIKSIRSLREEMAYLGEEMGKMQVVLDSGALVGATTKRMDQSLGRVVNYKSRGN